MSTVIAPFLAALAAAVPDTVGRHIVGRLFDLPIPKLGRDLLGAVPLCRQRKDLTVVLRAPAKQCHVIDNGLAHEPGVQQIHVALVVGFHGINRPDVALAFIPVYFQAAVMDAITRRD